ncbi:MAG: class I SAM-dependent methyltransferase, partial [Armatimonadetes bacterium]|nr:class I SAM-dependent methyltransferase [Armatimonadota bacterium]
HEYQERPKGETPFAFNADTPYRRTLTVCGGCGHYYSAHAWDEGSLYEDAYYDATYGAKLRQTYDRINALPPERSDNVARAARIDSYCRTRWAGQAAGARPHPTVLDVGSGLCVFLYRMKERGWAGTALDPGQTAITHAQEVVGVAGIRGDFFAVELLETYDLLTFNKVMEHVKDPVAMLRRCHELLTPGGLVYVELPDGEAAITDPDGPEREEFFIEHHHVFSAASLTLLAWQAEFQVLQLERIREPSGKYTLYAFLAPAVRGAGTVGPGRGD